MYYVYKSFILYLFHMPSLLLSFRYTVCAVCVATWLPTQYLNKHELNWTQINISTAYNGTSDANKSICNVQARVFTNKWTSTLPHPLILLVPVRLNWKVFYRRTVNWAIPFEVCLVPLETWMQSIQKFFLELPTQWIFTHTALSSDKQNGSS
jgi:hypothetical protein